MALGPPQSNPTFRGETWYQDISPNDGGKKAQPNSAARETKNQWWGGERLLFCLYRKGIAPGISHNTKEELPNLPLKKWVQNRKFSIKVRSLWDIASHEPLIRFASFKRANTSRFVSPRLGKKWHARHFAFFSNEWKKVPFRHFTTRRMLFFVILHFQIWIFRAKNSILPLVGNARP